MSAPVVDTTMSTTTRPSSPVMAEDKKEKKIVCFSFDIEADGDSPAKNSMLSIGLSPSRRMAPSLTPTSAR